MKGRSDDLFIGSIGQHIACELFERELAKHEGKSRHDLGRDAGVAGCRVDLADGGVAQQGADDGMLTAAGAEDEDLHGAQA